MGMDLGLMNARRLLVKQCPRIALILIGCGGTGSWLAPAIARLARVLEARGKEVKVTFVDPDFVEAKNVWRQNFCEAEIRRNKAVTLASRYGLAWGLEIDAVPKPFKKDLINKLRLGNQTHVLIGCVDNAAARGEIAEAIKPTSFNYDNDFWWLDCGNTQSYGQVLVGNQVKPVKEAFDLEGICSALPSPHLQHPELLIQNQEEAPALSCADMAQFQAQSLTINQRVAAEAADYLLRMLVTADLNRFASYFDLTAGSGRSVYITPENVAKIYGEALCPKKKKSRSKKSTTPEE